MGEYKGSGFGNCERVVLLAMQLSTLSSGPVLKAGGRKWVGRMYAGPVESVSYFKDARSPEVLGVVLLRELEHARQQPHAAHHDAERSALNGPKNSGNPHAQ